MNKLFKKIVALGAALGIVATSVNVSVLGAGNVSAEFTAAYNRAFDEGITTMPTEDDFAPMANINREQATAMILRGLLAVPAVAEQLMVVRNYDNDFTDFDTIDPSLADDVITAYEHGLVNGWDDMFHPKLNVNRAQVMTILGRALYGQLPEGNEYRANYYTVLNADGIFTVGNFNAPMKRYEMALVLYRIAMNADDNEGDDPIDDIICELLGTCEDSTDPVDPEEEEEEEEEVEVDVDGSVLFDEDTDPEVTAVAKGASVTAASFNVESMADDDVRITSLVVTANGLFEQEARDSLKDATLYVDGQRVSRVKSSFNSDDEAIISFLDGGYDLGEGDVVRLDVVVTVETDAATSEVFFLELTDVNANADVDIDDATGPEFTVSPAQANELTVTAGSASSDVRAGENEAEIFSFELEADQNEDITVHAITFESIGSADAEDTAMNFVLEHDNDVIATADDANGDYVSFVFDDPLTIQEDDKETFYVHADIGTDGIGEELQFRLETTSDLVAEDEEGNGVVIINLPTFDAVSIDAGELTLNEIEIEADELRIDKDNVVLGYLEVDNRAGNEIELQQFGIEVTLNGSTTGFNNTFESFEVVINGDVYELDAESPTSTTNTIYGDDSIDVILPAGMSEFTFRADILETADVTADFELSLDNVGTLGGNFYVEELAEDEPVTDIVPSSLSWNSVDFTDSDVEVSFESLADRTFVKGANEVKVSTFRVEAGESDDITMDDVVVDVVLTTSGAARDGYTDYNQVISAIRLTDGQGNVLDEASGNDVAANGNVNFNDMDSVVIPADEEEVYHVYVDIVDGNDAIDKLIEVELPSIDFEDEDNDDVSVSLPGGSANIVTVTDAGTVISSFNASDDVNEDNKTILAGDAPVVVYAVELIADNEAVDVDTVTFEIGNVGGVNLSDVVSYAALWLDGELIDTNSNSDIDDSNDTITFEDMNDFIIPEFEVDMELQLYTNPIGNSENGDVLLDAFVTEVTFTDAEGDSSNDNVNIADVTADGATFSVVPATLEVALADQFGPNDSSAEFTIGAVYGDNTKAASNGEPDVQLVSLTFADGNTTAGVTYSLEDEDGVEVATGSLLSGNVFFDMGSYDLSSPETFTILANTPAGDGYTRTLDLLDGGAVYNVTDPVANAVTVDEAAFSLDLGEGGN